MRSVRRAFALCGRERESFHAEGWLAAGNFKDSVAGR